MLKAVHFRFQLSNQIALPKLPSHATADRWVEIGFKYHYSFRQVKLLKCLKWK